jgi:hypothetical protein
MDSSDNLKGAQSIAGLQLDTPTVAQASAPIASTAASTGGAPAYVVLGSIIYFDPTVSIQAQQDVLQSILIAQLAAGKKVDRYSKPQDWNEQYQTVLSQLGWHTANSQFELYTAQSSTYSLGDAIPTILRPCVQESHLSQLNKYIHALDTNPRNAGAQQVFNSASHSKGNGNFQVYIASDDAGVEMQMATAYFQAHQEQDITDVIGNKFSSSDLTLSYIIQSLALDSSVYARVRDQVTAKLQHAGALGYIVALAKENSP